MKIQVTLKTPDCLDSPALEYAKADMMENPDILAEIFDSDEECYLDVKRNEFHRMMEKWFKYGEYVTLEIDTELKTCTVVE